MPYWITSTLAATPALIWMFVGVGLPWALVALPHRDWRDRVMVACLALAFGPAILTAWMFVLGSVQGANVLRLEWVLLGTAVMAAGGWVLVWRRRTEPQRHYEIASHPEIKTADPEPPPQPSPASDGGSNTSHREEHKSHLAFDERLLIGLVIIALIIRWIGVAYWPTTAYDALWVYGFEGRLYTLVGHIPTTIEYYPQFLPLQHTFIQLAVGGINDHAARAVLPWLHLGSILGVYVMGNRLFSRRVGIYAAAIWALYPHMGEWSRYGDLEVPVTFMFTGAAAFFVLAWMKAKANSIEPQSQYEITSDPKTKIVHPEPPPQPSPASDGGSHIDQLVAYFQSREKRDTQRYAAIAGLFLGIGLWTKPTMGAFVWGVALVAAIALAVAWWQMRHGRVSVKDLFVRLRPQVEVVLITGIVCIPLGGMWYLRNILLGHAPVIFPDGYWQTLAARSGVEFGWPLLALLVLIVWVIWRSYKSQDISYKLKNNKTDNQQPSRLNLWQLATGLVLVVAGVWPSIYNTGRVGITDDRMGILEWLALAVGVVVVGIVLWRWARGRWTDEGRETAAKIGWLWALGLPYFITWFYSYSYHYRLSFAIVPLMIMPTAVILSKINPQNPNEMAAQPGMKTRHPEPPPQPSSASDGGDYFQGGRKERKVQLPTVFSVAYLIIIAVLAIPGIINPLYDVNAGWDWLWTDKLPDDHARYTSGNQALMNVVDGLQKYSDDHPGEPLRVVAPQVKRLPFFFPTVDIQIDPMPTKLDQLDGVTYFIYGKPEAGGDFNTFTPGQNQVLSALSLATTNTDVGSNIMRRAWGDDDGIFKYTVYELHLENRFKPPGFINGPTTEGDVQFGGFVRLLGYDIGGLDFWPGRRVTMHLFWQVIEQPKAEYMIFIHLRDKDGNVIQTWDGPVSWTHDGNAYSTLVWEAGEYIVDERLLTFEGQGVPQGKDYKMVVGMYDLVSQKRVPMTINGQPAGEGYNIAAPFSVVAVPAK